MSGTYKALGINLKSAPLGESDRLLTILTEEFGLIRAVAPGSRKHRSSLGGRSGLFVVNQLLIAKGKNLDKITQAQSLESYPGLSQDLSKLTASQYLAELVLCQALSEHPQPELFYLLREHLSRLERLPADAILPGLVHATFHLLALAGLPPQVQHCCVTQQLVTPDFTDPQWQIGFSAIAGGVFLLSALEQLKSEQLLIRKPSSPASNEPFPQKLPDLYVQLGAIELDILQQLAKPNFIEEWLESPTSLAAPGVWLSIEHILRQYAQYHFDRSIRSAVLIDACFADAPSLVSHDATL
ncbi:MAG TPA: DNA repair protein RecO [Coleofasciculaceae cyanobacterium]